MLLDEKIFSRILFFIEILANTKVADLLPHNNVFIYRIELVEQPGNSIYIFLLLQEKNRKVKGAKFSTTTGWSGGAMVLGKLPVPGRPTISLQ